MKYILTIAFAVFTLVVNAQSNGQANGHDKNKHGRGHAYGHYTHNTTVVNRTVVNKTVVNRPVVTRTIVTRPIVRTRTVVVPTLVRTRFVSAYPRATRVIWVNRPNYYTATYYDGPYRTVTTYTTAGNVVETRTFIPVTNPPQPVILYREANPSVRIANIERLNLPNRDMVYRIKTMSGNYVYINESGVPVTL